MSQSILLLVLPGSFPQTTCSLSAIMDLPSNTTSQADPCLPLDGYPDHTSSVFRPVNPWKMTLQQCLMARHSIDTIRTIDDVQPNVPMFSPARPPKSEKYSFYGEKKPGGDQVTFGWWSTTIAFLTDWLPRRIFINLMFHIPSVYLSRFEKTCEEAGESLVDMKRRALDESRGIKQRDIRAVELKLIPIRIGKIPFDLVYVFSLMLLPAFMCVWMWLEGFSQEPLDPMLKAPRILVLISAFVANIATLNWHEVTQLIRLAAWNFNMAMDTRGIHQSFFWNKCVDLSMRVVWTIWGYIFFAVFILLAYLRRCWDLPDLPVYAKFTADPLT
ncbi:hypothetical protein AGABI2DRAFT_120570 [Agaricus bisporus var. bisporus H97]|uniref:hypothetical protein n=1 Tax=Agaricus bisporus var. bisporus (strain H97 / ATCC MYA-4626 / FGSC 10389) TaxID=936046 RepID=UPI00029F7D4B|nr:hypothetical protein AGABI2DRAFT_120570 [Agaricus bisporus var. bisporus H97]EKV44440.1 hypothetical protein AGABI2DRAFT_120570 [Agaricus bisporus var. bisporus H97]